VAENLFWESLVAKLKILAPIISVGNYPLSVRKLQLLFYLLIWYLTLNSTEEHRPARYDFWARNSQKCVQPKAAYKLSLSGSWEGCSDGITLFSSSSWKSLAIGLICHHLTARKPSNSVVVIMFEVLLLIAVSGNRVNSVCATHCFCCQKLL